MKKFLFGLAVALVATAAVANEQWTAWGGRAGLEFDPASANVIGLTVVGKARGQVSGRDRYEAVAANTSSLKLVGANYNTFEHFLDSEMVLSGGPQLVFADVTVDLSTFSVRPRTTKKMKPGQNLTMDVYDASGKHVFYVDHIHLLVDRKSATLTMKNMDLKITDALASQLNVKGAAGYPFGVFDITAPLQGFVDNDVAAKGCPLNWPTDPAFEADVSLIDISTVAVAAQAGGMIAVTPSARLRNADAANSASVPWYTKFSGVFDPYDNDQHPFLVWAFYKMKDGKLEQLGVSEVKHAFLTINSSCTCNPGDGHILGLGCEDVYGTGNNNNRGDLGFRDFIDPHKGIWQRCGSPWDDDCNDSPDAPPITGDFDRRLTILETDVDDTDADYFMEAWYVVRDDINIFNTMGYRPADPHGGATWTDGSFVQGPVFDTWVAPAARGASQLNNLVDTGSGHLKLGVTVVSEGDDFRYNYSLMAYDFDGGVASLSLPVDAAATFSDYQFSAAFNTMAADWSATGPGALNNIVFAATSSDDELRWGRMVTFSILSPDAPLASTAVVTDGSGSTYNVETLAPSGSGDLIFGANFDPVSP